MLAISPLASAASADHIVEIENFAYIPSRLDARAGDTVTWINRDIVAHTASAVDGSWDSGEIAPGKRNSIILPAQFGPGYFCAYHPGMRSDI